MKRKSELKTAILTPYDLWKSKMVTEPETIQLGKNHSIK